LTRIVAEAESGIGTLDKNLLRARIMRISTLHVSNILLIISSSKKYLYIILSFSITYSNNCVNLKYSDYIHLFILAKTHKKNKKLFINVLRDTAKYCYYCVFRFYRKHISMISYRFSRWS